MMKINIKTADKVYAQALGLTLARCLKADVAINADDGFNADYTLCDEPETLDFQGEKIAVSRFEPVSKLVNYLKMKELEDGDIAVPNVRAVAVTGMGGSGVSTVASIGSGIASELYGKKVLLVSFNGTGGPGERTVYELLTSGNVDLSLLEKDERGVWRMDGGAGPGGLRLNPLGRLSRGEAAEVLARLGRTPGPDLVVLDVPLASPHWALCVRAAETTVVVGQRGREELVQLIKRETKGLNTVYCFDNEKEDCAPDILSETGARLRRFVQEKVW